MRDTAIQNEEGWLPVALDQLGVLHCGQSPASSEVNLNGEGEIYVTGPEQWHGNHVASEKWTTDPKRIAPENSIFIAVKGAGVGKMVFGRRAAIGRDVYAFEPHPSLNRKYIFWAIKHSVDEIIAKALGDIPGLSKSDIVDHVVRVPNLRTQQAVVEKIEELFSELDKAVESLTLARAQCEVFIQANFERVFAGMADSRALPDLLSKPMTNGYSGKPVKDATPWRVLSLSATTSGKFLRNHFKYLDEPGLDRRDIWCEPGDVLVQRGNTSEYVGVPAIYTGLSREFIFPDLMIRLRADLRQISPAYLCYALAAPRIRNEMRRKAKGSAGTMPKISQKILSGIRIPYCDQEQQHRITQQIDEVGSRIRTLQREIVEQALRVVALRQSILKKAFSGQLVPQDPSDEPATALLARVREQMPARTRRRKTA